MFKNLEYEIFFTTLLIIVLQKDAWMLIVCDTMQCLAFIGSRIRWYLRMDYGIVHDNGNWKNVTNTFFDLFFTINTHIAKNYLKYKESAITTVIRLMIIYYPSPNCWRSFMPNVCYIYWELSLSQYIQPFSIWHLTNPSSNSICLKFCSLFMNNH